MIDVSDILLKIVNDSVVGNWQGGNERGIGYDVTDTSFDTWYSDGVRDFLDWYVENYQEDNDDYPPSWVLDVINYEKDNYGEVGIILDVGNDYERFHTRVNYIKLMEYIFDNDDDEVVGSFKEDMEYVFNKILENEREDDEEVVAVAEVAEVDSDTDSSDSDDSDSDDSDFDIVVRDTDHIYSDSESESDSDSDSD